MAIDDMKQKFMYNCFLLLTEHRSDHMPRPASDKACPSGGCKERIIEASQNLNFDKCHRNLNGNLMKIFQFTDRQNKLNARPMEGIFQPLPKGLKFLVRKRFRELEGFVQDEEDIFSSDSTYEDVKNITMTRYRL